MVCRICLIDLNKDKVVKEKLYDGTYAEAEEEAGRLNEKLNNRSDLKSSQSEKQWKVTEINI